MERDFFERKRRAKFAKSAKKVGVLLALVFFFVSSPFCFAQDYFIHTTKEDFDSAVPYNIDTNSSPGDVKLSLKPRASWWDEAWLARLKIRIENNDESELPAGYTVSLVIDHVSLVAAGKSLENGSDVRIVYHPIGETPLELDRVLEDDSFWNSPQTTILFKTQRVVPGLSADEDYFLYFDNQEAGDPPHDPQEVFAFFEDFEEFGEWGISEWEWCNGDWCRTNTALYPEISSEKAYSSSKSLKLTGPGQDSAVYTNSPIGKDYTATVKFYTDDSRTEAGLYFRGWTFSNLYPHFGFFDKLYQLNTGRGLHLWDSCRPPDCSFPQQSEWNTLKVKVVRQKILETRINNHEIWWRNQPEVLELPDDNGERIGFSYRLSQPLYYDDLTLRLAVENEPTLTLLEEQDEYEGEGSLESSPFDAQGKVGWDKISWEGDEPEGTEIYFQVATSDDGENWSGWSENLTHPSGSPLSFLPESRLIKYKAVLKTENSFITPVLHEVRIFPANSLPQILKLNLISSDSPHTYTTSTLTAQVTTFDEDGDEVTLDFVWYKNGVEIFGASNTDSLTGDYFQKGDEISVKVTPSDGKTAGVPLQSGPKIIQNSPPSIPNLVSPENNAFLNINPPTLTWEASEDPDQDSLVYEVEIDSFLDFSSETKLVASTSATSYNPDFTWAEGEYFWRVKAYDGEDESNWSEVFKFTLDVTKPETSFVKTPSAKTTETSAEFTWLGTDNVSAGLLFSFHLDSGAWSDFGSATTAVFSDLTDGNHTFEVRAKDEAGNIEDTASFSWEVDTTPPSLPSSFSAEAADGKVTLSWSSATDSDLAGYNLYRSVGEENDFKKINSSLLITTSFVDTDVENGKKYYYRITSVDNLGNESGNSSALGVTPQGETTVSKTEVRTETIVMVSPSPGASSLELEAEGDVLGKTDGGQGLEPEIFGQQNGDKTDPKIWEILTRVFKTSLVCSFLAAVGCLTARFR